MKIKSEHFEIIKSAIASIDRDKIAAHRLILAADIRVKDLEKRLRWDVLYATKLATWLCDNVYPYADDNNVDTAIRKIFKDLQLD